MADLKNGPSPSPRILSSSLVLIILSAWGAACSLRAGPTLVSGPPAVAPQPPPIQHLPRTGGSAGPKPLGVTPYSIGQPTDEEQLYLEYLNRMRADPTAEGQRLAATTDPGVLSAYGAFSVDLSLMVSEFATNPPVPPLAMNAQLLAAARWHSGDMFTNKYQGHFQTNNGVILSPGDRVKTNGYNGSFVGENVFANATSVFQGHAAFAVDWGGTTGGMQDPPGHRDNMLFGAFREVGIGVVDGLNGTVGPQLVTQDFGTLASPVPLITGVVYFDFNGNGFYDIGEGIGGVTVNTSGSTFFTVTANSGGYALPVPGDGSYTLTFTASGLSTQVVAQVSGGRNIKLDYLPAYTAPTISGPNPAVLNQPNSYTFSSVAAATNYQWQQAQLSAYTLIDGAETGLSNVTVSVSGGYSVITTEFAATGTHSFHLEHLDPTDQSFQLNALLLVGANSVLSFADRLGFALSNEVAEAQISTDRGTTWQTVWNEAGNDASSPVDSAFVHRSISLNAYAGQIAQVRFVYANPGGFYFSPNPELGMYLDDIGVSNVQQLGGIVVSPTATGGSFNFVPSIPTNYLLAVRGQVGNRTLPWGPPLVVGVTTVTTPPQIQIVGPPVVSGSQVQIDVMVSNYRSGMALQLFRAGDVSGPWVQDTSAALAPVVPNSKFRFTTTAASGNSQFFKVRGS